MPAIWQVAEVSEESNESDGEDEGQGGLLDSIAPASPSVTDADFIRWKSIITNSPNAPDEPPILLAFINLVIFESNYMLKLIEGIITFSGSLVITSMLINFGLSSTDSLNLTQSETRI